jgi:hypothetical protein
MFENLTRSWKSDKKEPLTGSRYVYSRIIRTDDKMTASYPREDAKRPSLPAESRNNPTNSRITHFRKKDSANAVRDLTVEQNSPPTVEGFLHITLSDWFLQNSYAMSRMVRFLAIQRASDRDAGPVHHVGVYHRGHDGGSDMELSGDC